MSADEKGRLDVFDGEILVGSVFDTTPLAFEYSSSWLQLKASYQIEGIQLREGRIDSTAVTTYFENLLPEGSQREALALERKVTGVFAILRELAGDNVGNLTVVAAGQTPQPHRYLRTSWEDVGRSMSGTGPIAQAEGEPRRLSISGAQRKTSVSLAADGSPLWPQGSTPSTHIVKPNIKILDGVWASATNESIIMRAAHHCGLGVAEVFFEPVTSSCVVKRFDRTVNVQGQLARLAQYDFCQLIGVGSDKKYEAEGGPGIADCVALIRERSTAPARDMKRFYEWLFFNLMVGNNDSHAKNLSFYRQPGAGLRLTPFYDLMCTRIYPGLSKQFAFKVGDKSLPGEIGQDHLALLAQRAGIKPDFLLNLARSLFERLGPAMDMARQEIEPSLNHSEKEMSTRLGFKVASISRTVARNLNLATAMDLEEWPDDDEKEVAPSITLRPSAG